VSFTDKWVKQADRETLKSLVALRKATHPAVSDMEFVEVSGCELTIAKFHLCFRMHGATNKAKCDKRIKAAVDCIHKQVSKTAGIPIPPPTPAPANTPAQAGKGH